jgi:hypothetical protein
MCHHESVDCVFELRQLPNQSYELTMKTNFFASSAALKTASFLLLLSVPAWAGESVQSPDSTAPDITAAVSRDLLGFFAC